MSERVSTLEVRQRLGDMLNRLALRNDEFIIERKGKPMAALVPIAKLEQMRRVARCGFIEFLERQKGGPLTQAEADALAAEARRWARKKHK